MKTILSTLVLLLARSASAQYRFQSYTLLSTGTNSVIAANTNITYNSQIGVGPLSSVTVVVSYKLTTNAAAGTNLWTGTFDSSADGEHYTNQFTLSLRATTNAEAWTQTNVSVANAAWFRLVSATNGNAYSITNLTIFVGGKVGL